MAAPASPLDAAGGIRIGPSDRPSAAAVAYPPAQRLGGFCLGQTDSPRRAIRSIRALAARGDVTAIARYDTSRSSARSSALQSGGALKVMRGHSSSDTGKFFNA